MFAGHSDYSIYNKSLHRFDTGVVSSDPTKA